MSSRGGAVTGVGAIHQYPLEVAFCNGIDADVRNSDDS